MQQRVTPSAATEYTYDALDCLIAIRHDEHTIRYTYDPFNRRLTKQHNGNVDAFVYQDQDEIGLWHDNSLQELRITSPNAHPSTIAIELNGIVYIPIHDLTGHIVLLLNLDGQLVEQYRYSSFGEREIFEKDNTPRATSAIGNPWQYSEKRYDEESGLLAFGLRYYDPKLARWITQDPAEFEDGPNRYAYVHNSPLILYDRYGLFSELNMPMPKPLLIGGNQDYIINLGMGIVASPLFQGTMQATGGVIEAVAGGGLVVCSDGVGAPIGFAIMTHGLDHFYTGMNTAITGIPQETATSQLLQQTGMSPLAADLVDNGISVLATLGATSALKGPSLITRSWKENNLALQPLANVRKAVPFQRSLSKATEAFDLVGIGKTTSTTNASKPFTRSNLKRGREMHKAYKLGQADGENTVKELVLPSGKRIDFVDFKNGIIYELKPNNPRSIKLGEKQLQIYKQELEQIPARSHINFKTTLETY